MGSVSRAGWRRVRRSGAIAATAPGVHTELWHLPQRGLTLFTVSNDDLLGTPDHQRALLRVVLEQL